MLYESFPVVMATHLTYQFVLVCTQLVGAKPVYNQFYNLNLFVCKQSSASKPNHRESKPYAVFKMSFVHSARWSGPKSVFPENQSDTKSVHSPKTQWKPVDQPVYLMSKASEKQSVKWSVIQHQLSSPFTRCQSLVLCWWGVRRCCSGGALASSQVYCSEAPVHSAVS